MFRPTATAAAATAAPVATIAVADTLTSTDPDVQAFYNSLTSRERIAHEIAIDKLGTSYDVTRTHGFTKWKRTAAAATTVGL